jgi:outer membrane receptor protein involved in Fe transport
VSPLRSSVLAASAGLLILLMAATAHAQGKNSGEPPPLPDPIESQVGSGSPVLLSRQAATTTVIAGEDLRSLGVRFLSDGFRIAPGLEITRMSSTEANVSLRGYNDDTSASQGVMALLDRRQVYNEFLGNVVWESLPVSLYEIDRIELLRGPGSFLYGPNAMHGLVNFITRSPMEYFRNGEEAIENPRDVWLNIEGGSYRSNTETMIFVHRNGTTALKVKLSHDDINEFQPSMKNAKDKVFAEARIESWLDGRDHRIEATAGIARQSYNILIPTFGALPPAMFDTYATEPYAKVNYVLAGLRSQVSWTRFDATGLPAAVYTPFHVIADSADIDVQWTTHEGASTPVHELTIGTGYRYSTFITEDEDVSGGRHRTGLGWAFVQDQWTIARNVWLTGGLRVDHHSRSGVSLSPRLAFVWEFDPPSDPDPDSGFRSYGQSIRATAGYGHRNPSLRELWFNMPVFGGAGSIQGNPDLKPEQIRSFEVGYWGRPLPYLQIECNLFYNLVDRLVQFQSLGSPNDYGPRNVNVDRAYGSELQVEAQLSRSFFAFANYAYGIRQDRGTGLRNPSAPRHKANGGLRFEDRPTGWSAMAWIAFTDDVTYADPAGGIIGKADLYALVNAKVAYRFKMGGSDGKVYVQAFNLLDHDHREHAEGQAYGILAMAGLELAW